MSVEPTHSELGALDPATRRIGSILDSKWTLERLLGVGGMAAVYAATHRNGARAAIKLFPFSVTTSASSAERILREGYLANKIGHPAIVRVLDDHLDRDREYAYLVMELLEGETARQRIERLGPMTPLEAIRYLIALADCLVAAHAKGVVHRDIKPENLFITKDGELKVLDFGVARALDSAATITRTGATLGTPAYMSPEQARGKSSEISTPTDIYSAGATLLFLVTGEFLHEGESSQEIMVRAAWTPARKVKERGFGVPDSVANIIDHACEFDPEARFESAAALRAALLEARAELEKSPQGSVAAPKPARLSEPPKKVASVTSAVTRAAGDPTLSDSAPPPPNDDTTHRTRTARSRLWVGGILTLALVAGIALAWPRAEGRPGVSASASAAAPTVPATLAAAAPSLAPATEAPPPLPEAPSAAPALAAAPTASASPRISKMPASPRHAPKSTGGKPAGGGTPPSPVKDSPRPASTGRDIGY